MKTHTGTPHFLLNNRDPDFWRKIMVLTQKRQNVPRVWIFPSVFTLVGCFWGSIGCSFSRNYPTSMEKSTVMMKSRKKNNPHTSRSPILSEKLQNRGEQQPNKATRHRRSPWEKKTKTTTLDIICGETHKTITTTNDISNPKKQTAGTWK